jgi:hypothetical protein
MKEGTKKATGVGSTETKTVVKEKAEVFWPIGGRHAPWILPHPLCVLRWEESFQSPDERLQNIPKVTRRSGVKPRSTSRRYKHKSRISSAT